jgi:hypothetical protein
MRRTALSRWQRKICEAAQIERRAGSGKNCAEALCVTAGGEAVDKGLEHKMHAIAAVPLNTSNGLAPGSLRLEDGEVEAPSASPARIDSVQGREVRAPAH